MLTTNKERLNQIYESVKQFHSLEELPPDIPNPQSPHLLPTLRPYQMKAVTWMLYKETHASYYQKSPCNSSETDTPVLLPKGGILADEMGLGKTVEVLACILTNPRKLDSTSGSNLPEDHQLAKNSNCLKDVAKSDAFVHNASAVPIEEATVDIKESTASCCSPDLDMDEKTGDEIGMKSNTKIKNRKRRTTSSTDIKTKQRKKGIGSDEPSLNVSNHTNKKTPRSKINSKQPREKKGETYVRLKSWYEDCLSEFSVREHKKREIRNESTFQCCCVGDVASENTVECPLCNTWQHADCVGYDETTAAYEYYCFQCWQDQPPVVSAGTVIISPEALSAQWASEIEKHVKKNQLKVLVYEGVRTTGYIQPHDLASYDIIITTYEVLGKELNYTDSKIRELRHAKRFYAPTSPLLFVEWWRLCLDEGQMVESTVAKAAEMAKKFLAINRWAITGTPIQKAVNDLLGLMQFLAGKEYTEFYELASRDWRSLLMLVPRILWRTQMKDVLEEAGVPPQTVDMHTCHFSEIEKYFYECTHKECSEQFLQRIRRFKDLNVTLKGLDRKAISNLLNPLLKLRQACLHPQVVRGKFVSLKKTMSMGDLVTEMITNAKLDAEQALRQLVASLNGSGALHIINQEWAEAAAAYRTVLHLEQEHKDRLKIDSLQKIHSMYNLAEVLDGGYAGIPPTLRDGTLRQDIQALELRYLRNTEELINTAVVRADKHKQTISDIIKNAPSATLGYSEWFLNMLEFSEDRIELLDRLKTAIRCTDDVHQKNQYNNLAKKLKSLYAVRMEVATWLADLDSTRQEVYNCIVTLKATDKDTLFSDAQLCHLPQAASIKKRDRCSLCVTELHLKKYEAMLFEEKSKEKRKAKKRNLPGSSNWEDDKDMDNKEIAHLVGINVNTFESSKKGGFKASPFERILQALASYGRLKLGPHNRWSKEAAEHMKLLQLVKKEFLDLNLLWRHIFDFTDAKDELNMCKMRLRLPYGDEEEQVENKKKKMPENLHIIAPYRVEPELMKLRAERELNEALVKKKVGTLCYLKTLQKEGTPQTICPVCRNDLSVKWSVLSCGHCVCLDCLSHLSRQTLVCPQCRQSCKMDDVSYVEQQSSSKQSHIKGTYSTKVGAVVSQVQLLIHQEPSVKILVFSTWDKVLDLLSEAFSENSITYRRLKGSKLKKRQFLKEFKVEEVSAFLLPLKSGAKGLNLVEATHVFLVEPILNPADELQAVGRVHRIGQTRPTVVHRFIIRDTIEERILSEVAASGADQWSDDCVTLQQFYDLFTFNTDTSLIQQPVPQQDTQEVEDTSSDSDSENEELNNSLEMDF